MNSRALRTGTSTRIPATNPRDGFRDWVPAGIGHAVPAGSDTALCGLAPPYVWEGAFDARSRVLDVCRSCASLAS